MSREIIMSLPDGINGSFELFGGLFILLHCVRVYRDKRVSGISIIAVGYFSLWGAWNLYYYPHLEQWISLCGGAFIAAMNFLYVSLLLYYRKK